MNELHSAPNAMQRCNSVLPVIKPYRDSTAITPIIVNESMDNSLSFLRLLTEIIGALGESTGANTKAVNKLVIKEAARKISIDIGFINAIVCLANSAIIGKINAVIAAQRQGESL